jgi:hypothetical protein
MRSVRFVPAVVVLAAGLSASACDVQTRETRTVTRSVELDKPDSVDVELEMGAGELRVDGGSAKLLDASFRFNVPAWEPIVDYQRGDGHARLKIQQPGHSISMGRTENTWDLRLNDTVPIALTAHLGAGEARLRMGSMNLSRIEINEGAGELDLDLLGAPKRSYDVYVNGGVGSATIRVPRSVAIEATAAGGIGDVKVRGLEKRGNSWYNPEHANDAVTIRLDVKGGVGEITITAE